MQQAQTVTRSKLRSSPKSDRSPPLQCGLLLRHNKIDLVSFTGSQFSIPPSIYLTNKEVLTVLCSVVNHALSGQSTKEAQGKYETKSISLKKVFFLSQKAIRKHATQSVCLMNEQQQPYSHEDCSGWQCRKTRRLRLMWPSTQCIGKKIRASSQLFTRMVDNVISQACFTVMTGDRHAKLATMDHNMIAFALTPSSFVQFLAMPVWLFFYHSFFVLFCFSTRNYM